MSEPILVHHGTADESCPIEWSQTTVATLQSLGKDAELLTYDGEPHAFEAAWEQSMERTVAFFQRHLRRSRVLAASAGVLPARPKLAPYQTRLPLTH